MTAFRGFGGKTNSEPGRAVTPDEVGSKEGAGPHLRPRTIEPRREVSQSDLRGSGRRINGRRPSLLCSPGALDEPTSGRCYNGTTQDGKRKLCPPGNRASTPAGNTWPDRSQIRFHGRLRWPWHLQRSRLNVPCVPRSWSGVPLTRNGTQDPFRERVFFHHGGGRRAGADGKTAVCSRRPSAADGRVEPPGRLGRQAKFCRRFEGTAATGLPN